MGENNRLPLVLLGVMVVLVLIILRMNSLISQNLEPKGTKAVPAVAVPSPADEVKAVEAFPSPAKELEQQISDVVPPVAVPKPAQEQTNKEIIYELPLENPILVQ